MSTQIQVVDVRVHTSLAIILFFNDTATADISPLSLHAALPIWARLPAELGVLDPHDTSDAVAADVLRADLVDRKSTRLNSSHANISYAVFCLKKKSWSTSRPKFAQTMLFLLFSLPTPPCSISSR